MLTIINLFVLDKIFTEVAQVKLTPLAKTLYTNCIIHHFRDKTPTVINAIHFELLINDIQGYNKWEKQFQELYKADLIVISQKSILFNNAWGTYIDRSKLENVSPEEYVAGFSFQPIAKFKNELMNSRNLIEVAQMKYGISKTQLNKLLELFIKEQETFQKKYQNFTDCIKHCTYWLKTNSGNAPKESVKSSGKILGG